MNCPGCGQSMHQHSVEGNYGTRIEIDACHSCSGFWFDRKEHLQLTPGSTLELIRLMGPHRSAPAALPQVLSCPRCGEQLVNTVDIQRSTRFNYFRCPRNDGHFITLFQFLREKNIVRSLSVPQINELRKRVKVIHCSNCGAPRTGDPAFKGIAASCPCPTNRVGVKIGDATAMPIAVSDCICAEIAGTPMPGLCIVRFGGTNAWT